MLFEAIEREIHDAYLRLATSAAVARSRQRHYLDGQTAGSLFGTVTALTAAHPWALDGFDAPAWAAYRPDPQAPPPDGLRVGVLRTGEGLPPTPAVARFAGHGHLLISESGFADGANGARSLLQALTLRLATATRPGTVRFALADPVGQGRHLSAFLRLPAQMRVGNGIAASPAETEALLTTLTSHVVEVTQTRLTNVYDSVEAYNAATTGTTVPYHVLVLAGFPAGVSDRAAESLGRLARNGPRSGLYIVATVDPGLPMPRDFDLAALTALGTTLGLNPHGDLSWDDPDFGFGVIEPDQMPGAARANPWLDAVGAAAGFASRDLPFGRIAVAPARRWTEVTTDGLDVQIGVDSKGEPQHFVMGVRGVHHGLVGGDVRMGKTNLLHVLISQLALAYPPEELELYLLDFKEVEFDAYLTERLPHARAITSRTDREFGLSMLRRFHDEIDRRARLCREAKVTDLPDYRLVTGQVLPRALVIMDEFQVLFSEEDRLAREAARLLADIAKRGAAFGLHLLLATQSPGGPLAAYLRPVYEQMALRIALGCTQPSVSQAILGRGERRRHQADPGRGRDLQRPPRRGRQPGHADRDATHQGTAEADRRHPGARGRAGVPTAGQFRPRRDRGLRPRGRPRPPGRLARLGRSGARREGVAGRGDRDQARHHGDLRALHPVQPAHRGQRGTRPRPAAGDPAQCRGPVLPGPGPFHHRRVHPALVAVSRFLRPAGEPAARGADCRPPDGGSGASTISSTTWTPGWPPPTEPTSPNGSSSSPGCTAGMNCWPRATTAGRARSRPSWSASPTRDRTPASTWWPGPTATPPPNARCGGRASASSACAPCSACCRPPRATRCSGCPPPPAWTTTAPCSGTPNGLASR